MDTLRAGPFSVAVAARRRDRLRGLLGRRSLPLGSALLLPRCRSVHTLGMCFALDLVWLDGSGRPVRIDARVPPGRVRGCRRARSVLEVAAGSGPALAAAWRRSSARPAR